MCCLSFEWNKCVEESDVMNFNLQKKRAVIYARTHYASFGLIHLNLIYMAYQQMNIKDEHAEIRVWMEHE